MIFLWVLIAVALALPQLVVAQLSGSVGPTTSTASKAAKKICNVLNYGAVADESTDIGPPIAAAWADCKSGGVVYIPPGNYAMATWQTLSGGSGWALQLDGIIYRTGTAGGHMLIIENTSDFELFSRTSQGAIQGYGYQFLETGVYGPRLIRLVSVTDFSVHDIKLIDSPAFHLLLVTCTNGEAYNILIRGANMGGLDGMDISGTNLWVHDVEVTNKDECVTIKSPASNMLVENVYCNWSGGCAMGSLGTDTAISKIEYNNVYTSQSNQMFMIKSNGGSGTVSDCSFNNFIGHSNAYSLYVNEYWSSMATIAGDGVVLSGLTFNNWKGTAANGVQRAPINVQCADTAPCTGITLTNIDLWTDTGSTEHEICRSAYGSGYCLKGSGSSSYTTTSTISSAPSGYSAATMPSDLPSGLGISVSIAIPSAIPTSFYPGVAAITPLLNGGGAGAGASTSTATKASSTTTNASSTTSATKASSTTLATSTKTSTSASSTSTSCAAIYAQCGGTGFTGPTTCCVGSTCTYSNAYYSQCIAS